MPAEKKMILIGPPGVGKTSLRMAFFDGVPSRDLVDNSLEPTRRREFKEYSWLGLVVRCVDCPGQSLDRWHTDDELPVFLETNAIIYMVEADLSQEDIIRTEFRRILASHVKYCPDATIYVLIHKSDAVPPAKRDDVFRTISTWIRDEQLGVRAQRSQQDPGAAMPPQPEFFLTSLVDGSAFTAMRRILNNYSRKGEAYQRLCDQLVEECNMSKGTVFILDADTGFVVAEKAIGIPEGNPIINPVQAGALHLYKVAYGKAAKELGQNELEGQIVFYKDLQFIVTSIEDKLVIGALVPKNIPIGFLYLLVRKARNLVPELMRVYDGRIASSTPVL